MKNLFNKESIKPGNFVEKGLILNTLQKSLEDLKDATLDKDLDLQKHIKKTINAYVDILNKYY
jgi:hypothetical protein